MANGTPPDDPRVFVARARAGDQRAFRQLYDLHVSSLFRFLGQFGGTREDVREWVQQAFIKAFLHLDRFDERSTFATWLFRIGLNEMRSDRRKLTILTRDDGRIEEMPAEDLADRFVWDQAMRTWLEELDEQKRTVFLLHEVEGFSHGEIARILDIEESHSRTILARTRSYLRRRWEGKRKAL